MLQHTQYGANPVDCDLRARSGVITALSCVGPRDTCALSVLPLPSIASTGLPMDSYWLLIPGALRPYCRRCFVIAKWKNAIGQLSRVTFPGSPTRFGSSFPSATENRSARFPGCKPVMTGADHLSM